MNDKMQVLFVKQTGHVVAAFTRSADPEGNAGVPSLVGSGLMIRNIHKRLPSAPGGQPLAIDSSSLDVAAVAFRADVFPAPTRFAVGGGVVALLGTAATAPTISSFTTTAITVGLGAAPNENVKVWVQVEQPSTVPGAAPERRVAQGEVNHTSANVTLRLSTSLGGPQASLPTTGSCSLLILVAGYRPIFLTQSPT